MLDREEFLASALSLLVSPQMTGTLETRGDVISVSSTDFASHITDPGRFPTPYRLTGSGAVKVGTDINGETAEMLGSAGKPGSPTDLRSRVTMRALYVSPSDIRFRKRKAKEYAALRISVSQRQALPGLSVSQLLAWSNMWSFVSGRQDFNPTPLSATAGDQTFQRMPLADGQGDVVLDLTTGTNNNNAARTLSTILQAIAPIQNNAQLAGLLALPAATLASVATIEALLQQLVVTIGPSATFQREFSDQPFSVATHSAANITSGIGVWRLPAAFARFMFIQDDVVPAFDAFQQELTKKTQHVTIDPSNGRPIVVGTDQHEIAGDLLSPFSIVVIETNVEATPA